ncbi:hypothetical protein [Eikenella corrodens]|uniref:Uncharacterized protein n=1 Tax=Eikenella corrodens ATCC 23834 TaxID=546274 RepID=C0DWN7_EIKCO|nr:hypothetical protein [Eikenella corrodens]EEG23514.1 hypothetical protein EIKCOROL_01789 [Eikenella corrodens ATCC 23834]
MRNEAALCRLAGELSIAEVLYRENIRAGQRLPENMIRLKPYFQVALWWLLFG